MAAQAPQPSVSIFGDSVAGLTAAHELAQRGFRVLVIEASSTVPGAWVPFSPFPGSTPATPDAAPAGSLVGVSLPACPRHLLDSMRRIPLGSDSSLTLADNLVLEPPMAIRDGVREPFHLMPGSPATSTDDYLQLRAFLRGSFSTLDVQMLFLRALRYLASCSARRDQDCANTSLLDYLCGREAQSGLPAFRFSASALARMDSESLLIAGANAEHCDARGALSALTQLHVGAFFDGTPSGRCLNGSLEAALLGPWRRHLATLGVRFEAGTLRGLQLGPGTREVRALVDWHAEPPPSDWFPSAYQIVASDVVTAERVTKTLRADGGVPADLQGLTSVLSGDPRKPERSRHVGRDPSEIGDVGSKPWDRLGLSPHVDFILPAPIAALKGVTYLVDSAWKLECSSAAASEFGPPGPDASTSPSIVRVTLRRLSPPPSAAGEALGLTPDTLAQEVWRQIEACLSPAQVAAPLAYRLDERLGLAAGVVTHCREAAFVAIAGDWSRRPEGEPSASDAGYVVHHGSLVFAGDYMRTFTRLGNLESANESARHAVNAILAHRAQLSGGNTVPEYCCVWKPDDCELPQLSASKELDAQLFAQGLPHLWDLLALELLPRLASQRADAPDEDSFARLLSLFEGFAAQSANTQPVAFGTMLDVLRAMRQYLEQRAAAGSGEIHDEILSER